MTNQEAIKILDNLKPGDYSNPYEKGEAIVMAISALQAQETINRRNKSVQNVNIDDSVTRKEVKELSKNSQKLDSGNGDCISRAAAMTAIQMIAERYTLAHEKMGDGRVEWSEYLVRMSDAFDVIRDLQSVEPYQEEIEIMTYPQVPGITPTVI